MLKNKQFNSNNSNLDIYKIIAERMQTCVFWIGANKKLYFISPNCKKITGYDIEEFLKNPDLLYQIIDPDDLNNLKNHFEDGFTNPKTYHAEIRIKKKSGEICWIEYECQPFYDESGKFKGRIVGNHDITLRKKAINALFEREEQFRSIYENSMVGIYRTTPDGKILLANPVLVKMLGYSSFEELSKRNLEKEGYAKPYTRLEFIKRIENEGKVYAWKSVWLKKDGSKIWVRENARVIRDKNGKALYYDGVVEDITKEKKAQEQLTLQSEALKAAANAIMIVDINGTIQWVNPAFTALTGYTSQEALGQHPSIFDSGKYPEKFYKNLRDTILSGKVWHNELIGKRKDGSLYTEEMIITPVKNHNGKITHFIAVQQDITARKLAEEELKASKERIRLLVETIPDSIILSRLKDGLLIEVNEGFTNLTGYYKNEILNKTSLELNFWATSEERTVFIEKLKKTGLLHNIEAQIRTKNGDNKPILISAKIIYIDNKPYILSIIKDISDLKKLQKEREHILIESEKSFRSIFENTGTATIIVNKDGTIAFANKICKELSGYDPEILKGTLWTKYIVRKDIPKVKKYGILLLKDPKHTPKRYEARLIFADGSLHICSVNMGFILYKKQLIVSILDITDRVQAEQERRFLYTAVEHTGETIFISDAQNNFIYVNKYFQEFYGYSFQEVKNKSVDILLSDRHNDEFFQKLNDILSKGKTWRGYLFNRKKDGTIVEVQATITPILNEKGKPSHFIAVHRDMTKEREMERRIQQSQRLESIGTLAGGIAHDFNNILTPILGYAELSLALSQPGSKLYSHLQQIRMASERAKDLVHQILAFSRKSDRERKPIMLAPIVKEALKLLRASIPTIIEIKQNIDNTPYHILGNPTEIHQIIVNLCTNAYQAMPDGGTLTISLEKEEVSKETARLTPELKPGFFLKLTVRDTGTGIPKNIIGKIFEPYFTTKGEGEGTGLGLATVHGIVTSMRGAVTVYSEPGKGTEFHVYFPITSEKNIEEQNSENDSYCGNEKILLVDDEPSVAELGKNILSNFGYKVTWVSKPKEVLNLLRKNPNSFDLLISDMTMPGMTGEKLAKEVQKIQPDLPIILMTGYSGQMNGSKAKKIGIAYFLNKPFTSHKLSLTVRNALDEYKNKHG